MADEKSIARLIIDELNPERDLDRLHELAQLRETADPLKTLGYSWYHNIKHLTRGALAGTLIEGGRAVMQGGEVNTNIIFALSFLDLVQYMARKVLTVMQNGRP